MYEVEQKARVSHATVLPILQNADAEPISTVKQTDVYVNHPTRDFAETDEALRLRSIYTEDDNESVILTYKGPRQARSTKTRKELEVDVSPFETLQTILDVLGFTAVSTVVKTRRTYEWAGCLICLDDVEGLGEFVEVEAHGEFSDIAEAETAVKRMIDRLGIGTEQLTTQSYLAMLLHDE